MTAEVKTQLRYTGRLFHSLGNVSEWVRGEADVYHMAGYNYDTNFEDIDRSEVDAA